MAITCASCGRAGNACDTAIQPAKAWVGHLVDPMQICIVTPMRDPLRFTRELRRQLGCHLCAIIDGWPQNEACVFVRLSQPDISRLRAGAAHRFTADRLLRGIAHSGHHVSIAIRAMQRRIKETPTITVLRYDRYGRLLEPLLDVRQNGCMIEPPLAKGFHADTLDP